MYWNYDYISDKFLTEVKNVWTIKDIVERTAFLGQKTYLIDAANGQNYSYEYSNKLSNSIANSFQELGLKKGDRVGIFMTNRPEYVFALFAVGKVGLVEVPINTNLRDAEISHIVNNTEITTIITENKDHFAGILNKTSKLTPSLRKIIVHGGYDTFNKYSWDNIDILSLDSMLNNNSTNPKAVIDENDNYSIFFTSGTTGMPKGAIISNKLFILSALSVGAFPVDKNSRNYTCLPLFHANAQIYSAMAMRCLGGSVVISNRFSPKTFWVEVANYNATFFNSIGGMMQILNAAIDKDDVPDHQAKFVLVGGTPSELWERFEDKFGVVVYEGYSMSEATVLFGNIHPEKNKRNIGSFGKPIFPDLGREVKVIDENKNVVNVGKGELLQRGQDFLCNGYWNAPEANQQAFDKDGWFFSGDIVEVDKEGYFYFIDRKKFMIRVAGENVSAFEVEDVVNSFPAVEQAAAIPVPDQIREEEVKVFIQLKEGVESIDFAELFAYCTEKLAPFKTPRYIEVISSFPKTATERIQKVKLKELEKEREDHGWDRNKVIPDWKVKFYK